MPTRVKAAADLALILLGCRGEPPSAAEIAAARETRPELERIPLQIRSETGTHDFTVKVARTPGEQAPGPMFRGSLSSGADRPFPFRRQRPASSGMKNTLIPLAFIFTRADGPSPRTPVNTHVPPLQPGGIGQPVWAGP